ncbi:SGNH/GDSL hydrolase family protein [Caldimonas sp. KR1-144]|uniref:SGNH/GDSL hydrolase family protein n=1 Tax=Caldimonas sp. KR1-144 TaxID=3400911 RepID=UPI003C01106A
MTTLAKIALGPLLLAQARLARRRAPVLPEADGEREGRIAGTGVPLSLLIVGDSSAAGVGVATQDRAFTGFLLRALRAQSDRAIHWRLAAKSGVNSEAALALLDPLDGWRAEIAVVVLGVNDVIDQLPPHRVLIAREALAARLRDRHGVRHTAFTPLPPMHEFPLLPHPLRAVVGRDAQRLNAALAAWARRRDDASLVPIDGLRLGPESMAADGFHPGEPVYRVCGEAVARHIATRLL